MLVPGSRVNQGRPEGVNTQQLTADTAPHNHIISFVAPVGIRGGPIGGSEVAERRSARRDHATKLGAARSRAGPA